MAELKIIRLGHPKLRMKSKSVTKRELRTKRFQTFLDKLAEICMKGNGVGIAAPQVGSNKRVIVIHVDPKKNFYWARPESGFLIGSHSRKKRRLSIF